MTYLINLIIKIKFYFWFFLLNIYPCYAASKEAEKQNTLSNHTASLGEVLLALMLIIALIFLLAWFMKRIGYAGVNHTSAMKIKACLPLSSKEKLLVIEIGDEQVVIGVAPGFVGHIKSLETPLVVPEPADKTPFASAMSQVIKGKMK